MGWNWDQNGINKQVQRFLMRHLIYISVFLSSFSFGQGTVANLLEELPTDSVPNNSVTNHTGLLPNIRQAAKKNSSDYNFSLNPLGDLQYRYTNTSEYRAGLGLMFEGLGKDKWYARISSIQGVSVADSIFEPKSYILKKNTTTDFYADIRSRISYTPNSIFNFQVGLDHNFVGEGCRSMFLGDYGKPYPFGQIRAKFWRVEYSVLYQFFRESAGEKWKMKNGATHYLSLNITKWLNLGIFESVIFQPKDTLLNRGYDAEYLNPVIFYRPQEYSLGSSDNVILGAALTARIKKYTVYSQFVLDEFYLAEIKAKSGWWANKFGGQIGVKGRFNQGMQKYFFRLEYNFARPFTFAHVGPGQNYGNQGMVLAHPYGANFMETLGEIKVERGSWLCKTFLSYFVRGYDKEGFSYGSDVYQPYTLRNGDYDHFIGDGLRNHGLRISLFLGYKVVSNINLYAFTDLQFRYDSAFASSKFVPTIGIRTNLWNDYRNY